jgi:hypothetical protein
MRKPLLRPLLQLKGNNPRRKQRKKILGEYEYVFG